MKSEKIFGIVVVGSLVIYLILLISTIISRANKEHSKKPEVVITVEAIVNEMDSLDKVEDRANEFKYMQMSNTVFTLDYHIELCNKMVKDYKSHSFDPLKSFLIRKKDSLIKELITMDSMKTAKYLSNVDPLSPVSKVIHYSPFTKDSLTYTPTLIKP